MKDPLTIIIILLSHWIYISRAVPVVHILALHYRYWIIPFATETTLLKLVRLKFHLCLKPLLKETWSFAFSLARISFCIILSRKAWNKVRKKAEQKLHFFPVRNVRWLYCIQRVRFFKNCHNYVRHKRKVRNYFAGRKCFSRLLALRLTRSIKQGFSGAVLLYS